MIISQLPLISLNWRKLTIKLTWIVLVIHPSLFLIIFAARIASVFLYKYQPLISSAPIALQSAASLELQSPLVTFVFFSRYLLPMSNKFTTFVPEIKWKRLRHSTLILSLLAYLLLCHLFMHIIGRLFDTQKPPFFGGQNGAIFTPILDHFLLYFFSIFSLSSAVVKTQSEVRLPLD